MNRVLFSALGAVTISLIMAFAPPSSAAQDQKPKVLPSDRTIRVLENFTWVFVLDHYRAQPETSQLAKDLKPDKFEIPKDDARRVIRRGDMSAQAQMCDLPEHQAANKVKLMKIERDRKKWSKEQLLFIHFLHFTAYAARMDFIKAFFEGKDDDKRSIDDKLKDLAKAKPKYSCPEEMRKRVIENIEAFVRSDGKS